MRNLINAIEEFTGEEIKITATKKVSLIQIGAINSSLQSKFAQHILEGVEKAIQSEEENGNEFWFADTNRGWVICQYDIANDQFHFLSPVDGPDHPTVIEAFAEAYDGFVEIAKDLLGGE